MAEPAPQTLDGCFEVGSTGDHLRLVLRGDLDLQCQAQCEEDVLPLVGDRCAADVHVDCRPCTFADARGIGLLVRIADATRPSGRPLLVEPPRQLEWVLLQTGTWSRFRIEGSHFPELEGCSA